MKKNEIGLAAVKKALDPKRGKGLTAISRALGGSPKPNSIQEWKAVPAKYVLKLEKASGVSRYRQRADIYGREPRDG